MSTTRHLALFAAAPPDAAQAYWRLWFGPASAPGKIQVDSLTTLMGSRYPDKARASVTGKSYPHGTGYASDVDKVFISTRFGAGDTNYTLVRVDPDSLAYTSYESPTNKNWADALCVIASKERVYVIRALYTDQDDVWIDTFHTDDATPVVQDSAFFTHPSSPGSEWGYANSIDTDGTVLFVGTTQGYVLRISLDVNGYPDTVTHYYKPGTTTIHALRYDSQTDKVFCTEGSVGKIYSADADDLTNPSSQMLESGIGITDDIAVATDYVYVGFEGTGGEGRICKVSKTDLSSFTKLTVCRTDIDNCYGAFEEPDGDYVWALFAHATDPGELVRVKVSDNSTRRFWLADDETKPNECVFCGSKDKMLVTNFVTAPFKVIRLTHMTVDTDDPVLAGAEQRSYWHPIRLFLEGAADVDTLKAWFDESNGLGTDITIKGELADKDAGPPASASTVDTVTGNQRTRTPVQRKAFYAVGRFWAFYADGSADIVFRSSTDGEAWSDETVIGEGVAGANIAICFDGTYVHYARAPSGSTLYYRMGTPQSGGTISWAAAEQTVESIGGSTSQDPSIAVDSNGYPWIACRYAYGGYNYWRVKKSSTKDGTWTTDFSNDLTSGVGSLPWLGELVALTNGKMYTCYHDNYQSGDNVKGKLYSGSWGSQEDASISDIDPGDYSQMSITAIDDDVHLAFLERTTYDIIYVKRTYGVGWGSDETVQASMTEESGPVISHDPGTEDIYCFWGGITADHVYYRIKKGSSWEAVVDWIDESTDDLADRSTLTCYLKAYDGRIGVLYLSKTSTPWNVRHHCLAPGPYVQPTGTPGVVGTVLSVANYPALDGEPEDVFTNWTSGSPKTLDGSTAAAGDVGDFIVLQMVFKHTSPAGDTPTEDMTLSYEDFDRAQEKTATFMGDVTVILGASAVTSEEAFGTLVTELHLHPNGIASLEAHGQSLLDYKLEPSAIASGEGWGTPLIETWLHPSSVTSLEAFGTHLLTLYLQPGAIASLEGWGTPLLEKIVAPGSIESIEAFGTPQLNLTLILSGIVSAEAFGTALIESWIHASGIASLEAFGQLRQITTLHLSGIASAEALGTPFLGGFLGPAGISSLEAFGSLYVVLAQTLVPDAIASLEALGSHYILLAQAVAPDGVASAEAFGTPALGLYLLPGSIASAEAFGLSGLHFAILPSGVASLEAFGTAYLELAAGAKTLYPEAITSLEAFGSHRLNLTIFPSVIASLEGFGTSVLTLYLLPGGVASLESLGTPHAILVLGAAGIVTGEVFGTPYIAGGALRFLAGAVPGRAFATGPSRLVIGRARVPDGLAVGDAQGPVTPKGAGHVTQES